MKFYNGISKNWLELADKFKFVEVFHLLFLSRNVPTSGVPDLGHSHLNLKTVFDQNSVSQLDKALREYKDGHSIDNDQKLWFMILPYLKALGEFKFELGFDSIFEAFDLLEMSSYEKEKLHMPKMLKKEFLRDNSGRGPCGYGLNPMDKVVGKLINKVAYSVSEIDCTIKLTDTIAFEVKAEIPKDYVKNL